MQETDLHLCGFYPMVESFVISTLALLRGTSESQNNNPNLGATKNIMVVTKNIAACHCAVCLESQNEAT